MALKEGSVKVSSHRLVSFLLGAALPTILLFLVASDRVGEHLSNGVSGCWLGSNSGTPGAALAPQDVDVIWFRNPFRHINLYADMAMSTDGFNGNVEDLKNVGNGGFYYIRSTNRTVEMLNRWLAARSRFPSAHDQGVLNEIKAELAAGDLQIKFVFLDTVIFGGFCQFHEEMDKVCTMHAICCIGLENKVHDLRNLAADWKNYRSLAPTEKRSGRHRWTSPNRCKASMRKH